MGIVFVVVENLEYQLSLSRAFQENGFAIHSAGHEQEAFALLKNITPPAGILIRRKLDWA